MTQPVFKKSIKNGDASKTSVERYLDVTMLSEILDEIADGIREGSLPIGSEENPTILEFGENVGFSLSLACGDDNTIHIEICWQKGRASKVDGLTIKG